MSKAGYISIDRVEVITGIPMSNLLDFALISESISFYYYRSSTMQVVPSNALQKLKQQLEVGEQNPVKINFLEKVKIAQLHMKDEDIRKCIVYAGNVSDWNSLIPEDHGCKAEGLEIAFKCWNHFYKHLSGEEEGRQIDVPMRKEWIEKNYPNISKNFRACIAQVANPWPKGGKKKKKVCCNTPSF